MMILANFLTPDDRKLLLLYAMTSAYEPGRQGTGYEKQSLLVSPLVPLRRRCLVALGLAEDEPHDCYLLRYPEGSYIPPHVDDTPAEHHRINCLVEPARLGGDLIVSGIRYQLRAGDAYAFRPDLEPHEVTRVERGARFLFTVGALQ
jgi:predicted 2-oxoglutarate/Fe(II)-dependent dioxygenase YbiX